ncbi:glycosyltransferase family 1 protein [Sphingomonas naphthae]|uniref:Glycosyltransferase family 1 protein n=1 Tax=Sphingomonas naphthae TaxID=1813468 RepID=A0ABY7TNN8_9SPHN|nr:glycosyltransferase family 1 protein [Sphingomonas naphthae]WCT74853.1 glycosyltransferase family 1 protein [Sphingomonas naphthae]
MGSTTYARNLLAALRESGRAPLLLEDRFVGAGAKSLAENVVRWLRARASGTVRLRPAESALAARDIFRLAQVRFDASGDLLSLVPPFAGGVMHWTYPVPIRMEGWANLYTVHDAIPLDLPDLTPIDAGRHRRLLTAIEAQAARLVTVSDRARLDIAAAMGFAPDRIVNCGQGVEIDEAPTTSALLEGISPGRYFLVCGTVERRKNIPRLVEAWRAARTGLPLLVVGPDGFHADEAAAALANEGVVRIPHSPRADLLALMRDATALLFPTLAEGFGLPIVEAMALGTPVMTTRGGATGEVAGDAAALVDPTDIAEMALTIRRLAADPLWAADLVERGHRRAPAFSRAAFLDRLLPVYDAAIADLARLP